MDDLVVILRSPSGVEIELFSNIGGSGDPNGGAIVIDDEAAQNISSATAPFNGTWRPEASVLSALDGLDASGNWTLIIQDTAILDTGTLQSWQLQITTGGGSGSAAVAVDEDDLSGPLSVGNNDVQSGDDLPVGGLPSVTGTLAFSVGADEPADITFVAMHGQQVTGTYSDNSTGQIESQGRALYYFYDSATHTLYATWVVPADFATGDPANHAAFSVHITDPTSGAYTFTLLDQLDHLPNGGSSEEPPTDDEFPSEQLLTAARDQVQSEGGAFEDNIRLNITYTVTDDDGDEVSGTVSFDVDDDVPVQADESLEAFVDEDELSDGITDNDGDTTVANGSLASLVSVGADEDGTFSIGSTFGLPNNLTSQGGAIVYDVSGNTLTGYVDVDNNGTLNDGDRSVFTLQVAANGDFTFTLLDQIDHQQNNPPNSDEEQLTIDLSSAIQYTDFDLDTITLSGGFAVIVEDDIPSVVTGDAGRVDEDDLTGVGHPGNSDVVDASDDLADPSPVTVSGSFGVDFGADGPAASGAISDVTLTNSVTSDGEAVAVVQDGANWVGRAGARDVFTLSFDTSTGHYTFTLLDNLDHPVNSTEDNLQLNFTFVATDFDQDSVNGSFSIDVDDDMTVVAPPPQNLLVNGDFVGGTFNGQADFPIPGGWGDNNHGGIDTDGIEGWTVTGTGGQIERVGNNYLGMVTSNGNPMIDMAASPGNIQIAQTIGGLTAGQTYVIQFEAGAPVPSSALLEVYWDNVLIATIDATGPMTGYNLLVAAAGASGTLSFREVGLDNSDSVSPTPGTHGHHGTYLANVGFVAAATVDEDGLNNPPQAVGIGDSNQIGDAPGNSPTVTSSLGIQWGADDNDTGADLAGVQDTPDGTGDRSLTFTNANVTVGGAATLTSNGETVSFVLLDNNTRLVGYVNSGADGYSEGERLVFEVTLSDDGSGSYTFTLHDNLDHATGANENDLSLSFNYTARDSDGDAANGSFLVGVDDDMPIVGENAIVYTDDETATSPDAEPNIGGTGDYDGASPAPNTTGTLAHTYGADGAGSTLLLDTNPTPGFTYTLSDGGQTLTISQLQDNVLVDVVRVTLTDPTSGNYTVEQLNEIDHPTPGADEENILLNVNYRVTDGDGDTVDGQLTIDADDDTPTVVADDICEDIPAEPGDVANFVLVLDTSGSVDDQFSLIQDAVENLLNQLGSSGAQDVRVHIVQFGETASAVGTYDIISGGVLNTSVLADAIADVNAMSAGGSTNYEAGFQQALQYIQGGSQTIAVDDLISSPDANGGASDGVTRLIGHNGQHIALISGWDSPGTTSGSLINANGSTGNGWGASSGSNDQIDPGQLVRVDLVRSTISALAASAIRAGSTACRCCRRRSRWTTTTSAAAPPSTTPFTSWAGPRRAARTASTAAPTLRWPERAPISAARSPGSTLPSVAATIPAISICSPSSRCRRRPARCQTRTSTR
jgi:T1SS-143 domain-containing protein